LTLENVSDVGSYRAADTALCLVLLTGHFEQTWESVMIDRNTQFEYEAKISPAGQLENSPSNSRYSGKAQLAKTPSDDEILKVFRGPDVDPKQGQFLAFQTFKVGLRLLLIDGCLQIVEAAKFIEIGWRHMGVHEGNEFAFVHTQQRNERVNFTIFGLSLIVGEVVTKSALGVDLHITALDVVEKDFGGFLVFLR
jgi:hypothetical protein